MGFKKTIPVFILFISVLCSFNAEAMDTKAKYAILVDYDTSDVLFEKAADEKMVPSSMTKLMGLYIAFQHLNKNILSLEDQFTVSKKAWQMEGSKMFLRHTEKVSIEQLLNGIIVQSGNDASVAMAEGIASTEEEFAELMNKTAEDIGLKNSHFVNSTGLPDENHYMSVRDIALLAKHLIMDFPQYYPLFSKKEYTHAGITQRNRNILLDDPFGIDGLKTGHTDEGGYGVVVSSKNADRRVIAVVNGLSNDIERAEEAKKLVLYGFRYFDNEKMFSKGQVIDEAPIWLGDADSVKLIVKDDVVSSVPKLPDQKIRVELSYLSPIPAPIAAGDEIAKLTISIPDLKTKEVPLYAANDVGEAGFISGLIKKVGHFLSN